MTKKYMGVEKYIFTDVYNFFLKYKNVPNQDYYWECCIQDAKMLRFKYKDYPLAESMINCVLEHLEFKLCSKEFKGKTYDDWEIYLGDYRTLKPFSAKTYKD